MKSDQARSQPLHSRDAQLLELRGGLNRRGREGGLTATHLGGVVSNNLTDVEKKKGSSLRSDDERQARLFCFCRQNARGRGDVFERKYRTDLKT